MRSYTPFLKSVAIDIKERFGEDIANIAIVFNNNRPITYLKKHLSEVYGKAIWSPQFFTIQDFLAQSTHKEEASQISQFFYLYQIHNQLLQAEGIAPESLEDFYPIAETLLSDFSQIDYDLVHVDHIYAELYDTTRIDLEFQFLSPEQQSYLKEFWQSFHLSDHTAVQARFVRLWKRLPLLYKAFKEELVKNKQTNFPTIYRNLAEGRADKPDFDKKYSKILFVGFNALNKVETQLFKNWEKEGKALFYFDVDEYYLKDTLQEAGLFIRRNLLQSELPNALNEPQNIIGNREDNIHLYSTTGRISQTKLLHDILVKEKKDKQEAATETSAIILADETLLVPLLQSLPDTKINITAGFPLSQSSIYGILDLWLRVNEEISHLKKTKIPYQLVEIFTNHPLSKVSTEEKKQIHNKIFDNQLFEIDIHQIEIKSSVLPHFFRPLASPSDLIPSLLHLLQQLLISSGHDNHIRQIQANLLIECQKVVNQLTLGLKHIPQQSIAFQIGLIRRSLSSVKAVIVGDPLEGIQIIGLLESRCLNFDNIYILGANEGILPSTSHTISFLPYNLRKAYGLPIIENQNALSAYLFYRQLQYSQGVHIFYNGLVDESSSGEESRFVKQLEFESKFNFIRHEQQQPIQTTPKGEELIIQKTGAIWDKMYNSYILQRKKLSATALTSYLQSPLQFFLKYIAEIKEPPSVSQEFEMNRLGTIIHNVMELIMTPFLQAETFVPTSVFKEELKTVEIKVHNEIRNQYLIDSPDINSLNSLQRIMHKIASEYVKMYLQYDIDQYEEFRIIELENDEDYLLDFPVTIRGKEETIRLYGIIDRVDQVVTKEGEIKTRIVDYKTGGDSVQFKTLDKVLAPNTENKALIQTLFYTYIYEQVSSTHKNLEPHLYVARNMREEGTVFYGSRGVNLSEETLVEVKKEFIKFLQSTLEEIFNADIPFRHNPEMIPYESDPYQLFYKDADQPITDEQV